MKFKQKLIEELSHDVHTIYFLFSFPESSKVETLKLENFLRAVPNVTVVSPQSTKRRGGRILIKFLVKIHDFYLGTGDVKAYVRRELIPAIKRTTPSEYRPTIVDWKLYDEMQDRSKAYRWTF